MSFVNLLKSKILRTKAIPETKLPVVIHEDPLRLYNMFPCISVSLHKKQKGLDKSDAKEDTERFSS